MNQLAEKYRGNSGWMKATACLLLFAAAAPAENGVQVQVVGGTVPELPAKSTLRLVLTAADALVFRAEKVELRIGRQKINTLEYGQNVSRRYAVAIQISPVLLLSKSRRHFVTVGYVD